MPHVTLLDEFNRLRDHVSAHRRGFEFQLLMERLFRRSHFRVTGNAGVAWPRQTDLLATTDREAYLVETKWQQRPANADDIGALFERLRITPSHVVGVLVSVTGFTSTVMQQVELRRDRPIVLVTGDELERLLACEDDVASMLRRKRQYLLVHGKAHIATSGERPRKDGERTDDLPVCDKSIVLRGAETLPWLTCGGGFDEFVFTLRLPDIDWLPAVGTGVTLDVTLSSMYQEDFTRLFATLAQMGWVSRSGWWSIQQATTNWHGTGVQALCEAIRGWEQRYRELSHPHHTELICYQDVCEGGFYTLLAHMDGYERRLITHCTLSFQLIGVPLDVHPFRHLCDTLEVAQPLYFRPRDEKSTTLRYVRGIRRRKVEPLAFIVEHDALSPNAADQDWVVGIVVSNPFRRGEHAQRRTISDEWLDRLRNTEYLICQLGSWHQLSMPRRTYRLRSIAWAQTSDVLVVEVSAEWDDDPATKRGRPSHARRVDLCVPDRSAQERSEAVFFVHDAGSPKLDRGHSGQTD